jgi:hypothetical protein
MSAGWRLRWLVLALCSAVLGCATITPKDSDDERGKAPVQTLNDKDLTGVWDGFLVPSCSAATFYSFGCGGVADISFTILPDETTSSAGFYAFDCPSGPENCGTRSTVGRLERIEIGGNRLWLRVMLPDGSACLFTSPFHPSWMRGGYECWEPMEQGRWQVERSY